MEFGAVPVRLGMHLEGSVSMEDVRGRGTEHRAPGPVLKLAPSQLRVHQLTPRHLQKTSTEAGGTQLIPPPA